MKFKKVKENNLDGEIRECVSEEMTFKIIMRVLIASVGRPEVLKQQEEIKLQVADFFFFLFSSNPVLSW